MKRKNILYQFFENQKQMNHKMNLLLKDIAVLIMSISTVQLIIKQYMTKLINREHILIE